MLQPITQDTWEEKYRYAGEADIDQTFIRIVNAIYQNDPNARAKENALEELRARRIIPAGRIHAGAGTDKRVTLINCFVAPDIQDSMDTEPDKPGAGIMDALKVAAITLQMGGGIGMDFSTLRPNGAVVKRTSSESSGVLPFMDMWHHMSSTIMSAGHRRGAMMSTLAIWHPDVLDFVVAKQKKGRLTNFNVSVMVTDAFMEALEGDKDWDLYFTVPRADGNHVDVYERDGKTCYVYKRLKARELWDLIIENTYIHAEPGILFMDRVNALNNLKYCEFIHCCNPCAEQMLPPNSDCDLGHINLAVMVKDPFSAAPKFDYEMLDHAAATLVRFLDNVLDKTLWPTEDQKKEAFSKRRIGIGYTGLANALQQLRVAYGSATAIQLTKRITRRLRDAVYRTSVELAKERGPFPLYSNDYLNSPFIQKLPIGIQTEIAANGIRNGVLMSIAPTGTISLVAGNVSSGIEPVFLHEYERKVIFGVGEKKTYSVYDYGYLLYHEVMHPNSPIGSVELPEYFVTAKDLTVDQHLEMQAAAQEYIDSAISKTINCPTEMTFEEFKDVYTKAYKMGLKGCTTYRPDPRSERGEVLSAKKTETPTLPPPPDKIPMQDVLEGRRYRVKWPTQEHSFYIQINDYINDKNERRPFELFINSKSPEHREWVDALALLITAIFRREGNPAFILDELRQVHSARGGLWYNGKYVSSLVAAIGSKIEEHFKWLNLIPSETPVEQAVKQLMNDSTKTAVGAICSSCKAPALVKQSSCWVCLNCGDSKCG